MNLLISGLLINNCIAISEPKEKPETQHWELSKFSLSSQSKAAAALDWLERENFDNSQCWISGFSFGSLIAMQLLMRSPEINRFIAISPQPNVYDFSFLSPCPTSGLVIHGKKDELVPFDDINELNKRLSSQKGIKVEFDILSDANHFFSKADISLVKSLSKYIKKETALY